MRWMVLCALASCAPTETTEVRAGDRAFTPTTALVGRGSIVEDDIDLVGEGGSTRRDTIIFVATDADLSCAQVEACEFVANALIVEVEVRETLLGDGLGDYDVPQDATVVALFDDGESFNAESGGVDLAYVNDDSGAISYEADGIESGAIVAERCTAIDDACQAP
jgi:hypothetical protein